MAKGLLTSGAKPARGGARKGAGRKPDWLKEKCKGLVDRNKLLEFVADVAAGKETEIHFDKLGHAFEGACSIKDRLHATEILLERGFGKPTQEVSLPDGATGRFILVCPEVTQ